MPLKFTKASVYIPGEDTKTVSAYKLNELATSSSLQVMKEVAAEKIRAFANKTQDHSTGETCTDSLMTPSVKIGPNIVGPTMSITFSPMICELDEANEQAVCSPSALIMSSTPTVLTWSRTTAATYSEQTCADTTLIGVSASLTIGGNDRNVSLSAWKTVFDLHPETDTSSPDVTPVPAPAPAPSESRIDCDELNGNDTASTVSVANLQPIETEDGPVMPTYYYTRSPSPSPSPLSSNVVTDSAEQVIASVPSGSNYISTGLGSPSPSPVSSPSPTASLYNLVDQAAPSLGAGPITSSVSVASVPTAATPTTSAVDTSTTTSSPAAADDTTVSIASTPASSSLASPDATTPSTSSSSSLAEDMQNIYTTTSTQAQESAANLLSWMQSQGLVSPSPAAAPVAATVEETVAPTPEEVGTVATPAVEPVSTYDAAVAEAPATEQDDMTDAEYDSLDMEGFQ